MITLYKYRLPFRKSFQTGRNRYTHREGVILHYKDPSFETVSEAAPLPGFSDESIRDVIELLRNSKNRVDTFLRNEFSIDELRSFIHQNIPLPSAAFAVSYLGLNLLSKRNRAGLGELFGSGTASQIRVNDVIPVSAHDESESQFRQSIEKGFRVFKLKADRNPEKVIQLLHSLNSHAPTDISFRLDPNQSWSRSSFEMYSRSLTPFPIEYIEEPINLQSLDETQSLLENTTIPIALDESIGSIQSLAKNLDRFNSAFVIIKPMRFGNIIDLFETISSRRTHFNRIVFTTMLESAIGRSITASVSSLIGDRNLAHGLNTGSHLKDDLIVDGVEKPIITIPKSGFVDFKITDLELKHLYKIE